MTSNCAAGLDDGAVDQHVVVEELGRPGGVRHDAADGAGDEEHVVGAVGLEPVVDRRLVTEIELVAAGREDLVVTGRFEPAHDRRADQSGVAGDEDAGVLGDGERPERLRSGRHGAEGTGLG